MPDDNPILRHWQTEVQAFDQNFTVLQSKMDIDAIHDLRVAIKKIRSYVKLYPSLFKKKEPEELLAMLRGLFSVFGKHRNIDIVRKLLPSFFEKNKPLPKSLFVYLHLLQDQITPYCKQIVQEFKKDEFNKFTNEVKQDFEKLDAAESQNAVKELIGSSMKTVTKDRKHFKKNSHLVRKNLKNIFYWSNIFDGEVFFTKPQLKNLDKILDHLGNIQDHEVLRTNLKNFRKTILSNTIKENELIKKIETRAEKKKENLLARANMMTEESISVLRKK